MGKLHNQFEKQGFVILAIDVREKKAKVNEYVKKNKASFPVLLDPDGKVADKYGVKGFPAHFLINRKGDLVAAALGAKDWERVETKNLIRFLVDQ